MPDGQESIELARISFPYDPALAWSRADSSRIAFFVDGAFGTPEPNGIWMRSPRAGLWMDLPAGDVEISLRCNATPELAAAGQRLSILADGDTLASAAVPPWGSDTLLRGVFRQSHPGPRRLELVATRAIDGHAVFLRALSIRGNETPREASTIEGIEAWDVLAAPPPETIDGALPDLLVILLDAARADHFGCYGYARSTTPNVDRLAAEGVALTRAYSTASYTRAALPSLMTGNSWLRHAVVTREAQLPDELPTLAGLLGRAGYHTLGITTNPEAASAGGLDRGFDEYHETWKHPERARLASVGIFEMPATLYAELLPSQPSADPLFAFVHVVPPHQPYDPTPAHDLWRADDAPDWEIAHNRLLADVDEGRRRLEPAERRRLIDLYDGNLHRADAIVARILESHRTARPGRELCVVVVSDHGEAFGEHGRYRHSSTVHEEMTRIPMIFWPRTRFAAIAPREGRLTALSDALPLILNALGIGLDPRFAYPRHLLELHADPKWVRPGIWLHANGEIGYRDERTLRIVRRFGAPEQWTEGELQNATGDPLWLPAVAASLRRLWAIPVSSAEEASQADREQLRALGYID